MMEIICQRCGKPAMRHEKGNPRYCFPCNKEIMKADKRAYAKRKRLEKKEVANGE